jgi:hypothetical protein
MRGVYHKKIFFVGESVGSDYFWYLQNKNVNKTGQNCKEKITLFIEQTNQSTWSHKMSTRFNNFSKPQLKKFLCKAIFTNTLHMFEDGVSLYKIKGGDIDQLKKYVEYKKSTLNK